MAIIKHIAIKNSNYDAATDYLTLKHDEFTNKPILDENGDKIPRDEFLIEGINCNPFTFGRKCEATNTHYEKNQTKDEIKAHIHCCFHNSMLSINVFAKTDQRGNKPLGISL